MKDIKCVVVGDGNVGTTVSFFIYCSFSRNHMCVRRLLNVPSAVVVSGETSFHLSVK